MNRRVLLISLAVAVVAAGGGWFAGSTVKSPAEVAAATAPPPPAPILVPAEMRELSTDVVTRGTGRFGAPQEVRLAPSTLKEDAGTATSVPAAGRMLKEGDVALTISGRPVFLLGGSVPTYRDLGPTMAGSDVRQLQAALQRLGLRSGPVNGTFDDSTEAAVSRLYARGSHTPFRATEEQLARTRPVQSSFAPGGRARAGVQVPADEVVFLPGLPVRVSEVKVPLGGRVDGAVLTVTNTSVVIDSAVPVEQAKLLAVGKEVVIDEPDLNIKGKGVIASVAPNPGTNGVDGFHVYFQVRVVEGPPTIVKASVRLRLPVSSSGKKVLAVPVTAVTLGPDGTSRVQKKQGDGFEIVTVKPRLSAGGFVEIEVVNGSLKPGDLVLVGFDATGKKKDG